MKKNITYKAPQGKLLRIEAEIENSVIQNIKITGDFFVHPEDDLLKLEQALQGAEIDRVKEIIEDLVAENQTEIVGFTPEDLQQALKQ